jgi:outer membrane receptor protein involved in Fe transport
MNYFFYHKSPKVALVAIMIFITSFMLMAQNNGTVRGIVSDNANDPLLGANVNLEGTALGSSTDEDGTFIILNVPSGSYTIVAQYLSFKTNKQSVDVSSGESVTVNFALEPDILNFDAVIVTGVQNPKTKLESSVAVTTMNSVQIRDQAPLSSADLLKTIPGFVSESTGGEVGNNLFPRGIASAGSYEYVQIQEDGLPVFEDGALQFANVDNFYRLDETVDRMESVRGGSGSIFASNSPGGIVNFISKTGGSEFAGSGRLTVGDYGLFRTDLNIGGPLSARLRYNMGGFYRYSNGIRSPGYPSDRGGQVKANLTYLLDKGYVRVFYKHLNDKNLFLLPIPLQNPENPEGIPGFDPNFGTYASVNTNRLKVPQPEGGFFERVLENGVHPIVNSIGAETSVDLGGGFTFRDVFRRTLIDLEYQALFPGSTPVKASQFAADRGITNPIYSYADDGNVISNPDNLNGNGLVAEVGFWAIDKQMQSFANNLSFSFATENNSVEVGYYFGDYNSAQQWNWSNILLEIKDEARLLDLADGNKVPTDRDYSRTMNGVTAISWLTRESQQRGRINAIFLNDELKATDQLTLDGGVRYEIAQYSGLAATTNFGAGSLGDSTTTADDGIALTGPPFQAWKYGDNLDTDPDDDDVNRFAFSVGGNYAFNQMVAVYLRGSNGFRSPIEEAYFDNRDDLSTIKPSTVTMIEGGVKYTSPLVALFANAFYMRQKDLAFLDILPDGTSENAFGDAQNIGLEIEAILNISDFDLYLSGTLQDPKLKNFGEDTDNQVRRIPKNFGTLRGTYTFAFPNSANRLPIYAEVRHFGKKYNDNANEAPLPSYSVLNAGIAFLINRVRFSVDATNLTNTIGLTEGNPRALGAFGDFYHARPELGRAYRFSTSVAFR